MKFIISTILALVCFGAFGQSNEDERWNQSGAIKLVFANNLDEAKQYAEQDIKNGTPFLLLQSGIDPIVYSNDSNFEKKYKTYYNDSGCTGPTEKFAIQYNVQVFSYLIKTYGNDWKKDVRKDVLGLKKWRRNPKKKE